MKKYAVFLLLLAGFLLFASPVLAGEVTLAAAASLRDVVNELSEGFAKANPGLKVLKEYGGSGALAKQIENGAPVDIFISANREWMDYLKNRRLIDNSSMETFAYNTLVVAGNPAKGVRGMADLVKLDKVAIGSPKSVPAGEYATEAMRRAGIEKRMGGKLVMARDVRDCLMYAERGEVDGAFVYRTDALQAKQARILFTVPQGLYPEVLYPMALTVAGSRNRDARSFIHYLRGRSAKAILGKYGFVTR